MHDIRVAGLRQGCSADRPSVRSPAGTERRYMELKGLLQPIGNQGASVLYLLLVVRRPALIRSFSYVAH